MKLLLLHTDYIEYEAKQKAIDSAPELDARQDRLDEALAVFVAVERDDEGDVPAVVDNAAGEIRSVASRVSVDNVMLYPYAHLSSSLAGFDTAQETLAMLRDRLAETLTVKQAPFGWYKAFTLRCKGHPLAELSRTITPEQKKMEPGETATPSTFYVLTPDGELIEADSFDFSGHEELKKFYKYEAHGSRISEAKPAHIQLMQDLELVDYEPGSGPGHMRWYPKGRLVKKLLERTVEDMCLRAGAMEVETPLMYNAEHPALKKYLSKFPARQYRVRSGNDELFMRFAACFGQYLMAHDMVISYRHLPLRLFELARSFRREQHGELSGIKRLRAFTMPDMHTLCAGREQALKEFRRQFKLSLEWIRLNELQGEVAVRFVRSFFEDNQDFAAGLAREWGRPILVEMWDERYFYFVAKYEFNMNDSAGKSFALSTVQIDVENPESFDITYTDEEGEQQHPLLLHTSISGGIDRCVCALLESEAKKMGQGDKGMLPFWLSPTQIRLIPVRDEFVDDCLQLADSITARVDVDDRDASVSKRIRTAEKEWVPVIIVYGDREQDGVFQPRCRFDCPDEISLDELQALVDEHMQGRCYEPLPLPRRLSRRPQFR
ncbi:MAG: threonine--tRNA ligase [Thermoplasmatota archaeon]